MCSRTIDTDVTRAPEGTSRHATRIVVATLGVLAAFAGVEHGVGELTQPSRDPGAIVIESWPHVEAFDVLAGEPAMTLIPDLRVSGLAAIADSVALGWWAVRARARRRDGWVLAALSLLLLLVGGGFGPPLLGLLLSTALTRTASERPRGRPGRACRTLGSRWRPLLVLSTTSFLGLFPGVVLLRWWTGFDAPWLAALLGPLAFTSLVLTLVAALAVDRSGGSDPPP